MSTTPSAPREPWLAAAWSALCPGLGQFQTGAVGAGSAFLVAYVGLLALAIGALITTRGSTLLAVLSGFVALAVAVASIGDAYRRARVANSLEFEAARHQARDAWKAAFLSHLVPGAGHFYLGQWSGAVFLFIWFAFAGSSGTVAAAMPHAISLLATLDVLSRPRARRGGTRAYVVRYGVALALLGALAAGGPWLLRARLVRALRIPSESMSPTLQKGDAFFIDVRRRGMAAVGEVVVFQRSMPPRTEYAKRVLAVGGDVVDFRADSVLRNGVLVWRAAGAAPATIAYGRAGEPYRVPEGAVFLVGDNLANSLDCRFTGPIPLHEVAGRAYHLYWPPDRSGPIPPAP